MDHAMPILLVPGLTCSARIYAPVMPLLWRFGPVTVANHIRDDTMGAIARRILAEAPPRFALAGHSMGGYIAFEIMRQAPERVAKLALINTQARPDASEASARRRALMARARDGGLHDIVDEMLPLLVHPARVHEPALRTLFHDMADDVGVAGFINHQTAIMARADSQPTMAAIKCPTLVLTGDQDMLIPNSLSKEMAEGIEGAKLVILPDCGHCPQPEKPEVTTEVLVEWLGNQN
ncbi:alpha/beta fold hydrolase [Bradyrhizobium canariense]|uniref:Pimeloyl-ACP methyl ester carboxylesterase n=1 Tax=Bradyrhizobium canariense TaxID=255045 RepID=A0A1H2AEY8_9BRAD|nr:alpha/beta hydrolase [Bradyrhizobium canariense]SDT44565.1 Pimeloyl-ACP methyl ester carboxylesterase [Bradyrhizobium canariense]